MAVAGTPLVGIPKSLVGGDWNMAEWHDFPETVGNGKSSQLTNSRNIIFLEGVGINHQPVIVNLIFPALRVGILA